MGPSHRRLLARSRRAIRQVRRIAGASGGNDSGDMFSLTFDDGPDPRGTPDVLDALAGAGARATFFVLGRRVVEHPALYARILAEGHAIGVHGHDHLRHPVAGRPAVEDDLDATLDVLGETPALWRVPWGELAPWTGEVAAARGLTLAGWTADTHDWGGDSAEVMLAAIKRRLGPGAVVLAHDGVGPGALREDCGETARLVGPLVDAARARGLEPVTLQPAWPVPLPPGNNPEVLAA